MRKINLRGLSEVLSEKELKNVLGGSVYPIVSYECCDDPGMLKNCWMGVGYCAGPDCQTCMGYPVAQSGYYCENIYCSQ
jgi:natural product precursor